MAGHACQACGTENPDGARFCMACGAGLERGCPACGTPAPAEAKFCMACGASLDDAAGAPAPADRPEQRSGAVSTPPGGRESLPEERRQVTVLFADLSGYTAVAETMDPEAVKGLVDRCLRRLGDEVDRFGGTVDKYIGDNVMGLFGAPISHEDDAERAVRAALAMQEAMSEINEDIGTAHGVTLSLRVGINTGEVLAGAIGGGYTVIGDTVNVAARLQAAGRLGSVTVGERTFRATADAIEYRRLEPLELKGKAERVPAWEVVGARAAQPVRRTAPAAETPLMGREYEIGLLESLYSRITREGRPHLVTLVGEAGVGKSRLLREFERRLGSLPEPGTFRAGHCPPYGSGIVYWALGEVIREECGIVDTDSSEDAWRKLSAYVAAVFADSDELAGEPPDRRAALIGRSIGVEAPPELLPAGSEDPERVREAFFSALRSLMEAMARRRPLVLAFEDIHWADDGMLDVIEHLAQWVRAPLLLLCLARDELLERRGSWGGGRRNATQVFLEPLTVEETSSLVAALVESGGGSNGAHGDIVPAVAERSGGNPLFAEEMVRRLAQGGTETAQLPDTVQAVLAARLDALDPFERRLVQQAAVVGQTFWVGSLTTVAAEESGDVGQALTSLQEKDILAPGAAEGRLVGERELAFKHVLIRDVAYGMLPKAVRSRKHYEVGRFIEERAGDRTDEVVPLLAEHYGRAATLGGECGLPAEELRPIVERALRFLEEAGDAAARLYANREAISHYEAASELCGKASVDGADPATRMRIGEKQADVALRLGRVDPAVETWQRCLEYHRGQEDLERVADLHRKIGSGLSHKGERKAAIEHYQKGINLLKDGPPRLELVRLYEEAAWLYLHTGDNMLAIYASEKALRLAERLGETRAASRAHGIFGRVFGRIGDTEKARSNLERSVELARGSDHGETILALLALGRHLEISEAETARAQEAYTEGLELAEQVGDLPNQVELHAAIAQLAVYRADWEQMRRSTEASAELAEREGLVGKLCLPHSLRGLLRWRDGQFEAAEAEFRRAHELAEQVGWSELAFAALFGLAVTLRDRKDYADAVGVLAQAVDVCERAGLIAQSIQAISARAVTLALAGKREQAAESAEEAAELAGRLHYPVGRAAALEAQGASAADPEEARRLLAEAREAWTALDRPIDAARCELVAGCVLAEAEPASAQASLAAAAEAYERLAVPHLAHRARELVPS